MSELCFFAFCITIVALTAISQNKDKVAEKALSILNHAKGGFFTSQRNKCRTFSKQGEDLGKFKNEK